MAITLPFYVAKVVSYYVFLTKHIFYIIISTYFVP